MGKILKWVANSVWGIIAITNLVIALPVSLLDTTDILIISS
jgi:quinol-cytochrome oxidoreductase complex cytochrome b subunit